MKAIQPTIQPGTFWVRKYDGQRIRVMAYAEGYVMARIPGRVPFVEHRREWLRNHEPEAERKL